MFTNSTEILCIRKDEFFGDIPNPEHVKISHKVEDFLTRSFRPGGTVITYQRDITDLRDVLGFSIHL